MKKAWRKAKILGGIVSLVVILIGIGILVYSYTIPQAATKGGPISALGMAVSLLGFLTFMSVREWRYKGSYFHKKEISKRARK